MKVRADILVALNVNIALWIVTPCSLTGADVQEESTASTVYSKVETTSSSEMLVLLYKTTRRHTPEYRHFQRRKDPDVLGTMNHSTAFQRRWYRRR